MLGLGVAGGFVALLVALWWLGGSGNRSNPASPAPRPAPPAAPSGPADYILQSGELERIDRSALAAGRPVSFDLTLAEPSRNAEPLPAQLRDSRGRVLDLLAAVEVDGRMSARLEVEPGWLLPGSYLVELRTTERSHFPLRRYPLEVR